MPDARSQVAMPQDPMPQETEERPARTPGPAASSVGRMVYLDALRAFAMFYGILVHSASMDTSRSHLLLRLVGESSDLFRMATFFLISGFFTAMACSRMSTGAYLQSRAFVLAVPLASSLLLLAPVTNWLIHRFHNGPVGLVDYLSGGWRAPTAGNDVWHLHFWFLFSLIAFALLTPLLLALARSPAILGPLGRLAAARPRGLFWLTILLVGLASMLGSGTYVVGLKPIVEGGPFAWIARATLFYFPFFLIGLVGFVCTPCFRALHRADPLALALFGTLFAAVSFGRDTLPPALGGLLAAFSKAALVAAIVMALLQLFERVARAPSRLVTQAVGSAYTVYLFHMTVIYALANLLLPVTDDRLILFLIVVPVATVLLVQLHLRVIAPSPTLRFLFNGRTTARGQPAVRPS